MHRKNRERKGNLKLECGWCAHCRGANIVILNWQKPLWKKSGRDEPMWIVIHMCMEAAQGISLYSYPYLNLVKPSWFSYYLLCFFLQQNQSTRGQNRWEVPQIMYTHVSKNDKIKFKKQQNSCSEKTKKLDSAGRWLIPVILLIWEAEIRMILV
jgi:hypothetical protein